MELISLQGKTTFFEKRVDEYQKALVMSSLNDYPYISLCQAEMAMGKTNFFEKRVDEYQKALVMSSLNGNGIIHEFHMDDEF
ncbi:hypothetical protein HPP92_024446 [Vanilla planifolia]|uniref:Uncharacterized protein n=1 Tax=Vanilla planifolia TaxID=51239 RepID=A0A835PPR3_VANPL|nr:hypothetical protein HPP92_024446 [Vanilla planifolia]